MAKYKPIDMVESYEGKICEHSDIYFQRRGKDKKLLCTGRICNPRDLSVKPYSSAELSLQNKFKQAMAAVKSLTSEAKAAYRAEFEAQSKYQFFTSFMFAKEYAKLV